MHLASIYSIDVLNSGEHLMGGHLSPEVAVSRWDSKCMKIPYDVHTKRQMSHLQILLE
jgi:hypothetical protein